MATLYHNSIQKGQISTNGRRTKPKKNYKKGKKSSDKYNNINIQQTSNTQKHHKDNENSYINNGHDDSNNVIEGQKHFQISTFQFFLR